MSHADPPRPAAGTPRRLPTCSSTTAVQSDLPVGVPAYDRDAPLDLQESPETENATDVALSARAAAW
jgi:hypothetical protein